MYYPTFLYCLKVSYDMSWLVQINMEKLLKGFLSLHHLGRPVYSKVGTLPLSKVYTVLSSISILLLAMRQLTVINLNDNISNVKV